MREKPILFRGEMVKAILEGRKSMTRRLMKPQPIPSSFDDYRPGNEWSRFRDNMAARLHNASIAWPWEIGSRLWVRETWAPIGNTRPSGMWTNPKWIGRDYFYAADNDRPTWGGKWRPSIHMPRKACRLVLEITDVRVERLNDISEEDAVAEGIEGDTEGRWKHYLKPKFGPSPVHSYQTLWESINGVGSWAKNEWVWVISFKRIEQ